MKYTQLDDTWRLVLRGVLWLDPIANGQDCYIFRRAGGTKPTDLYTDHIIPVQEFWGGPWRPTDSKEG